METLQQYRSQVGRSQAKNIDKNVAKAEAKNRLRAFNKLTRGENGEIRIVSDPPLIVRGSPARRGLRGAAGTPVQDQADEASRQVQPVVEEPIRECGQHG